MAIESRSGQTVCNTSTDKNPNLVTVTAATDEHGVGSHLDLSKSMQDGATSFPNSLLLSDLMVDGLPPILSYFSSPYIHQEYPTLRKCPNSEESNGNHGNSSQVTESYGGARPRRNNPLNFTAPRGPSGGRGNGDDEGDKDKPTDYKKMRLNCDGKQKTQRGLKPKRRRDGALNQSPGRRGEMNVSPWEGDSKAIGRDEVDASMVEQAALLRQERTTYAPVRNQVIYSTHHGNVIAFIQRLYTLWSSGSGITPGLSEGVIFNMNQKVNDSNQYRFGEEFVSYAELGRGDFGITRACQDWKTGAKMASKEIPRERFLPFEVLQLSKLRSPFIARFLGATAERSSLYLHMELVDNAFQLEYIAKDGSMWLTDQGLIVKILHQLLGALDCLQKSAVIHRDLTCRNVLLTAAQRVKVIDFNLAVPSPYEQNTMPVGDIHYLAPEVLDGVEQLTCAIDLWSAGIIIIALLRSLPQLDDCEKMAVTGFHPLHCCHLRHCHPRLLDILELILQPDQRDRPAPQDLANHCVFQDDIHEILEDSPARPDDGVDDSPDWFPLDDHCSDDDDNDGDDENDDDNDGDDVEATIPPVSMPKSSPEPHPCLTSPSQQPSSSSVDQSEALVQITSTSHTVGDNSNNGPRYGRGKNPCRQVDGLSRGGEDSQGVKRGRGSRGKDRKVQIAAHFRDDTTKHSQDQGTGPSSTEIDCGVGDEATTGQECRNDPSLVGERPITQQMHAAEYRTPGEFLGAARGALGAERGALGAEGGAVGGLLGAEGGALRTVGGARRHHGKHHPNDSMGSLADILRRLEVNEITQTTSRFDRGREGHNVLRDHHQQQDEVSDNPTSLATGSNDFKDLCDGPYCYPVDWLYANDDPQATVEERDQSGNRSTAMSSPKMSTGGSSFRGTSQLEASLEMDILVGQLSIDTTPEYQNQILSQFSRESRDGRSSSNSSNQS